MNENDESRSRIAQYWAELSRGRVWGCGLALAAVLEALTAWCRFGLGRQATRDTAELAVYTFGLRIHHGYYGVVLLLVAWLFVKRRAAVRNLLLVLAIGLSPRTSPTTSSCSGRSPARTISIWFIRRPRDRVVAAACDLTSARRLG